MELTYLIMTFYTQPCSDDTTFFLEDLDTIKNVLEMLNQFCMVSGLRPNFSKCEIAGIGSLKDARRSVD